jgi:hypothetical protein
MNKLEMTAGLAPYYIYDAQTKNSQVALRVFLCKFLKTYALASAAIRFNAEPATNQPI